MSVRRDYLEDESFWSWLRRWWTTNEALDWARYERGEVLLPPEGHPDRRNPLWVDEAIAIRDIRIARRKRAEEATRD